MLFRKAFTVTLATQGLVFLLGTLNTVLIVRAIGAEGRGIYSILLTSVSILSVLSSGGIIWSNTYWVGKEKESVKYLTVNGLYQTVFVFLLLLFLLKLPRSKLWEVVFEGIPKQFFFFSIVLVFLELGTLHLNSILLGLQDFYRYNLFPVVRLTLFTLLNLCLLYGFEMNVEGVIYGWMISGAVFFGMALMFLVKQYSIDHLKFSLYHFARSLNIGGRALLSNIFGQLLLRSDLFLINWYLGLKEVGYYSVGVAVGELLLKIPGIAGNVLFPKVASNDFYQDVRPVTRITRIMGIPLLLMAFLFILYGEPIFSIAFGSEFTAAYPPLIWIVFGIIALSYHVILDNYFAGRGYPAIVVWTPGVALLLNIGMNLVLIPKLGITGAAVSTCFAYLFLTAVKYVAFRKGREVSFQDFFIPKKQDLLDLRNVLHLR